MDRGSGQSASRFVGRLHAALLGRPAAVVRQRRDVFDALDRHAGGRHGGGSALSSDGLYMLEVFKQLSKEVDAFADGRFAELYNKEKTCGTI